MTIIDLSCARIIFPPRLLASACVIDAARLHSISGFFRLALSKRYGGGGISEVARAKATLQVRSRRLLTDLSCLREALAASIFRRFVTARATVLTEEISTGYSFFGKFHLPSDWIFPGTYFLLHLQIFHPDSQSWNSFSNARVFTDILSLMCIPSIKINR